MTGALIAVAVIILGLVVLGSAWQRLRWASQCRAGAAKIHSELTRMYAGEHDITGVSPGQFPGVDRAPYDRVAADLAAAGFRAVGSFEDLTVSSIYPHNRTYADAFVSEDGRIGAGTYGLAGRQFTDLVTALEDGRVIVTTNADADKLAPPPFVRKETLPGDTLPRSLAIRHRARLAALESASGPLDILPSGTLDDAIAHSRRQSRLTAEHRRAMGFLTEAELMSMVAAGQEATGRRVWEEFVKLIQPS